MKKIETVRLEDLKIDEDFKNLLPDLTSEEYTDLEKQILRDGVLSPIVIWNGTIIDGHNRYAICKAHRMTEVPALEIEFSSKSEAMLWILSNQFARRNLKKSEAVRAYQVYEAEVAREAEARMKSGKKDPGANLHQGSQTEKQRNPKTAEVIAKKLGVSERTYRDMKLITEKGTSEQVQRMDEGGHGNGVSTIAAEIKRETTEIREEPTEKKCKVCGRILPITEFMQRHDCNARRNECRTCMASIKAEHERRILRDVKGDIIKSTGEFSHVSDEEVIGNLYDVDAEVITTKEEVAEEITVNARKAITMLKRIFESNREIIKDNEETFSDVWSEIETMFSSIRREYIA